MTAAIDHVVIAVNDLEQAAKQYRALGFTLTPRAQHPWGTANQLVQLEGRNFIELLEVDRPPLVTGHDLDATPPRFSFGAFNRDFIARQEGMSMLVLAGHDSHADVTRFRSAGLQTYAPFDFAREATLPDGSKAKVAFSLAFATHPDAPDAGFFSCHNRFPDTFWRSQYQTHANGAQSIAEVLMVSDRPEHYADFLAGFSGSTPTASGAELYVACGPQRLRVLTPDALARRFPGEAWPPTSGLRFAALEISGDTMRAGLTPSREACGVAIEWEKFSPRPLQR